MAAGTKLVISYTGASGDVTHTYKYADPDASTNDIKALVTAEISNAEIWANPPVSVKTVKLVTTSETDIVLD